MSFLTYEEALAAAGTGRKHLLLGNGFSIGCDGRFSYDSLFEYAREQGLSDRLAVVFQRLGTNNFEGVMRALEDAGFIATTYELSPESGPTPTVADDIENLKGILVAAVADRHLDLPSEVDDDKKQACVAFLSEYHNVFTTNYDLLLYWIEMYGLEILQGRDGFRSPPEDPEAPYLEFHEHVGGQQGIFFLHGALHLYVEDGELRKHSWLRSGKRLTTLIREGLTAGQYPLFVAEGDAEKKRDQITRSGYLSYALGKLERIEAPLITYGLRIGESDRHILNTVADARKIEFILVGIFEDEHSVEAQETVRACEEMSLRRQQNMANNPRAYRVPLNVQFFDSKTASPWN